MASNKRKIVAHRVTLLLENENSGYCYHLQQITTVFSEVITFCPNIK